MDKYKLHPSGWGSLSNETEVYCELYNLKLTETVSSLDGMKNVYFMPSTEFPRADFKKYYPNVNIRRVLKNIDCVIFDNNTAEPTSVFVEEGGKYNPAIFQDTKNKVLYTQNKVLGNSFYDNYESRLEQPANTIVYAGKLSGVKTADKYLKIINNQIPCIHIDSVFTDFTNEVRQSDLTMEEAVKYYRQVQTKDASIVQAALDIVASLDPNVYLPFQSLILSVFHTNTSVLMRDITSKKFKIFNKFMKDKSFVYNKINESGMVLNWYNRQYIDTSPWGNLNKFITLVNTLEYFTGEMDYDTSLYCLLQELKFDIRFDHLNTSTMLDSINSTKINSSIINVMRPEVPKPTTEEEFSWGV